MSPLKANLAMIEEEDHTLYFPQGMAGFEDAREFGFIDAAKGGIACMRALERPEAKFLVAMWDESTLGTYPEMSSEQRQCLMLDKGEQPLWLLVLNSFTDPEWILANMRAPIAINADKARGMQCIRTEPELKIRHRWIRKDIEKSESEDA